MPIYEYECPKCGKFEVVQKVDEKPLKAKPDCTDKKCPCKAQKLISAAAFHLKGSGWYKTDYTNGSASNGSSSGSSDSSSAAASDSGSTSEAKSDSGTTKKKKSLKTTGGGGGCGSGCSCH